MKKLTLLSLTLVLFAGCSDKTPGQTSLSKIFDAAEVHYSPFYACIDKTEYIFIKGWRKGFMANHLDSQGKPIPCDYSAIKPTK